MVEPISQIIQRSMKLNCLQVNVTLNALFQKIICSYTEEDVLPCLPVNTVVEMLFIFWTQHPFLQLSLSHNFHTTQIILICKILSKREVWIMRT